MDYEHQKATTDTYRENWERLWGDSRSASLKSEDPRSPETPQVDLPQRMPHLKRMGTIPLTPLKEGNNET